MSRKRRNKKNSRDKSRVREFNLMIRKADPTIAVKAEELLLRIQTQQQLLIRHELKYLKSLDLSPVGNPVTDLIRELLRISREVLVDDEDTGKLIGGEGCFINHKICSRCKEIGEELSELTKDDQTFFDWFFNCDLLSIPQPFRHELYFLWDRYC